MRFLVAAILLIPAIGFMAFVFLWGLDLVTHLRLSQSLFFLLAPFIGLLTGYFYSRVSSRSARGHQLLMQQLSEKEERISVDVPMLMAPLIVLNTWLSHLAGLSVGREGTAMQAGGGIASLFAQIFKVQNPDHSRLLLRAGIASGFAAVFGVPLAGFVFSYELIRKASRFESARRDGVWGAFYVLAAAFAADQIARLLGTPHSHFPRVVYRVLMEPKGIIILIGASVLFGSLAWLFLMALDFFRNFYARWIKDPMYRPAFAGLLFTPMAFAGNELQKYAGLGVSYIEQSLSQVVGIHDSLLKLAFTVFSVGSGFRGGEVTPLFFIGATAGSSLSGLFSLSPAVLGSLGLCAVFGAVAGVPLSCAIMAAELFGPAAFLAALPVCLMASSLVRRVRLYEDG